jgi:UDP-N-acetylmuramate: L-alanyl-gamma-D-glutamyl-meso-diaminopimelate ligase
MKVHFIAIGGSAMHNLAIALHKKGYIVSGSDDEIFDPSRQRLIRYGLYPHQPGWHPDRIHNKLDAVILGMHARADNPELLKAKELGLKIFSYPEYLYEQSKNKIRIVIGGSHGKTTITSMILHVLQTHGVASDFMVGAQLEGFEVMVQLTDEAQYIVIEGDEYLSSPVDLRPKFHIYKPHIALISGIAWDHINVFPTFEMYLDQFRRFIHCIEPNGKLIYCAEDSLVKAICEEEGTGPVSLHPYSLPDYEISNDHIFIKHDGNKYAIQVFGQHNLLNLNGAKEICRQMGISDKKFYEAIGSFKGASRRLEKLFDNHDIIVYRDFAHAPSKIMASTNAVKEFYPDKNLVVCLELHTYSSLNENFIHHYRDTLIKADEAIVFFDPHAVRLKKLPELDRNTVIKAFNKDRLSIHTNTTELLNQIKKLIKPNTNFLFMSSGNFGGLQFSELLKDLEKVKES